MKKSITFALSIVFSPFVFATNWSDANNLPSDISYPSWIETPYSKSDRLQNATSNLYVDLKQWIEEQNLYQTQPTSIYVFADTIEIKENFNLVMQNQNLVIFARRVIGPGSPTFVIGQGNTSSSVTIISPNVESPFNVISFIPNGEIKFDSIDNASSSGTSIIASGNNYFKQVHDDSYGMFLAKDDGQFRDIVNRTFDMAVSVYDSNKSFSLELIKWIENSLRKTRNLVESDPILIDLYSQALAFRQFIELSIKSKNVVPYLDRSFYRDKYQIYLNTMMIFEQHRERIIDRNTSEQDKIETTRLAISSINDVLKTQDTLISQTKLNIDKLFKSVTDVESQYQTQEITVLSARSNYLYGVEVWKTQQQLEAALAIFQAIADIGSAVSGVYTGSLAGVNNLTEQLSKTPEALDKAKNLVTNLKAVTEVIGNITKVATGIASLTSEVKSTMKYQKITNIMDSFDFAVPTLNESNLAWDMMLAEVRSNLRYADSLGIRGARNFLLELEKQVLLGKAINSSQLNLVQEQAKLVDLLLTRSTTISQKERLEEHLQNASDDSIRLELIERELARTSQHFKRPMFIALSNYLAAFEYWSLTDSQISPSLNKSYLDYQVDLTAIETEYLNALNHFQPAPQDFSITNYNIDDKKQIAAIKNTGQFNFSVSLDDPLFCAFDRVRLNKIRVFLEGAELPFGKQFNLNITSTGNYLDRLGAKTHKFNSKPLQLAFYYHLDDPINNQTTITTDGSLSGRFNHIYFEPTPFSNWNISLNGFDKNMPDNNQYLEHISNIRVEFYGNGIPNGDHCSN